MAANYKKLDRDNLRETPRKNANIFSILSFWWVKHLLTIGNKRPLESDDLSPLLEEDQTQGLTEKLQQAWNEELAKNPVHENEGRNRLFWATTQLFSLSEKMFVVSTALIAGVAHVFEPIFLSLLLSEMINPSSSGFPRAYVYAAGICVCSLVRVLAENQFRYDAQLMEMRWKSATIGLIYDKVLHLSQARFASVTSGHILSLVSSDVQRSQFAVLTFVLIFQVLFEGIVVTFLIWYMFGLAALTGVAVSVVAGVAIIKLGERCSKLRDKIASVADGRLNIMNSVITGIRTVKMYAWELPFVERVQQIRRQEISLIRRKCVLLAINYSFHHSVTVVASFASLASLAATGTNLTTYNVFMVLSLIGAVNNAVCRNICWCARTLADTFPGLNRIQKFLEVGESKTREGLNQIQKFSEDGESETREHLSKSFIADKPTNTKVSRQSKEEVSATRSNQNDFEKPTTLKEALNVTSYGEVTLCGVNSYWNWEIYNSTLKCISMTVRTGELVVIAGPVGCGKSSLLFAILQEMPTYKGQISCTGKIAYVPQIPWVFSGTVRDNIVFGQPLDLDWYRQVLQACDLHKDLQSFPDGDMTRIGERGVILSGGQRARIGLARAVYNDANVYLLDDPFSAVDTKVAKHLFEECVTGLLGGKTRLMVTHSQHFLKDADRIVVMKNCAISQQGSYDELVDAGIEIEFQEIEPLQPGKRSHSFEKKKSRSSVLEDSITNDNTSHQDSIGLDIVDEDRLTGSVSCSLYWSYFRAGVSVISIVCLVLFFLIVQGSLMAPNLWLLKITSYPRDQRGNAHNFYIYGGLVAGAFVAPTIRGALWLFALVNSSKILHDRMTSAILKAPVLFFDTNPVGRIINRFSRDIGVLDESLPNNFLDAMQVLVFAGCAVLLVSALNPWIVFGAIPLVVFFVVIARYYMRTSRELLRLEAMARSPVLSHLSNTLEGLVTIRAYHRKNDFLRELYRHQDKQNQTWYWMASTNRWLSFNLDICCVVFAALVVFLGVAVQSGPGITALSLVYALQLAVDNCEAGVQLVSLVENSMTSVERVITYTQIEQEPGYQSQSQPPKNWPDHGQITVDKLGLVYYHGGPEVLKDISFTINPHEKIGIVGRTGAGKSSLVAALFRMPEPSGDVIIDGVSISDLDLQSSRRAMSAISQNPVLFCGTLRINLDPFKKHQDKEIWEALEEASLKAMVENLPKQLYHEIRECGANFSVGERQLLCLARTLLQKKQIVVMDEATANVDFKTDQLIQATIRTKFKDHTVITVAHRLNTILDYDRVLVFDKGRVVEFDKPERLLEKEGGIFSDLYHQLSQTSDS